MSSRSHLYLSVAFLIILVLSGCAINEQMRTPSNPDTSTYLGKHEAALREKRGSNPYDNIEYYNILDPTPDFGHYAYKHKTAYVEFDEQGDFFDRGQLLSALANTPTGTRRLLIFYAHGWENNTRSRDVLLFNEFLAHLSRALNRPARPGLKPASPGWEVYGVYLAWRGTLYAPVDYTDPHHQTPSDKPETEDEAFKGDSVDPVSNGTISALKPFSFWSRKTAASRFAGGPLLETIQSISDKVRGDTTGTDGTHLLSRTILMGHSFGAFIMEKTLLQAIATEEVPGQKYLSPPADLVVLLNSAAPAIYAKEFIDYLKWHSVGDQKKPFVVSITSDADLATKLAFPAGTIPETLFDVGSYQGKKSIAYQGANEKSFFTHTPGHCDYIISHDVVPNGPLRNDFSGGQGDWLMQGNLFADSRPVPGYPPLESNEIVLWGDNGYGKTQTTDTLHDQIWALQPPGKDSDNPAWAHLYNNTTYWILRVPKQIIADHGDVWNPNTESLLSGIFRMSGLIPQSDPNHPGQFTDDSYKLRSLIIKDMADPKNDYLTKCMPYPSTAPGGFH